MLMVSHILYRSLEDLDMRGRGPFAAILLVGRMFVLVALGTATVLFSGSLVYAMSGPVFALFRKSRRSSGESA